jgi:bifunctional non-homologous end joining protein LigD
MSAKVKKIQAGLAGLGAKRAPLPQFVPPSLATLVESAPASDQWVHEIKFDGYRLQARIEGGAVTLLTRTGQDWTGRFSTIAKSLKAVKADAALLDGEIVVELPSGITSFVDLVADLKAGRSDRMTYYIFDLLHLDGFDLTHVHLLNRKAALKALLDKRPIESLRYSQHIDGKGETLFKQACRLGLEGIISKRKDSLYRSGRNTTWLKTKCIADDEFVIGGYLDSSAYADSVGALAVGYYGNGKLIYAGRVGTGFSRETARDLWKEFRPLKRPSPPFASELTAEQRRGVIWVNPQRVAQVEYRGWTNDGLIRHGAFKVLREDKPAKQVSRPKLRD